MNVSLVFLQLLVSALRVDYNDQKSIRTDYYSAFALAIVYRERTGINHFCQTSPPKSVHNIKCYNNNPLEY